jgi:hypothetical protein
MGNWARLAIMTHVTMCLHHRQLAWLQNPLAIRTLYQKRYDGEGQWILSRGANLVSCYFGPWYCRNYSYRIETA